MSQQATRQSQRIRCPSYQPRTTWRLPEIVSVRISISNTSLVFFSLFLKGVPPTSFTGEHPHHDEDITTSSQDSEMAASASPSQEMAASITSSQEMGASTTSSQEIAASATSSQELAASAISSTPELFYVRISISRSYLILIFMKITI